LNKLFKKGDNKLQYKLHILILYPASSLSRLHVNWWAATATVVKHINPNKSGNSELIRVYSHSTVAGGFDVMSWQTRFTPRTLLHIFPTTSTRDLWSK